MYHGCGKDLSSLAQGDNKTGEKISDTIFFLSRDEIKNICKISTTRWSCTKKSYSCSYRIYFITINCWCTCSWIRWNLHSIFCNFGNCYRINISILRRLKYSSSTPWICSMWSIMRLSRIRTSIRRRSGRWMPCASRPRSILRWLWPMIWAMRPRCWCCTDRWAATLG